MLKGLPYRVDKFVGGNTNELFVAYDSLMKHLVDNLDLTQCKDEGYDYGHLVFSFYEYYLQMIPFSRDGKKYIYINAYRRGKDKFISKDESPSEWLVNAFDGGYFFWRIVYDIEAGIFIDLKINGV